MYMELRLELSLLGGLNKTSGCEDGDDRETIQDI